MGAGVFEKPLVLRFAPSGIWVAAAAIWILVLFFLVVMASGKRRAERTGRIFTLTAAERICETAICISLRYVGSWIYYRCVRDGKEPSVMDRCFGSGSEHHCGMLRAFSFGSDYEENRYKILPEKNGSLWLCV